MECTTVATVPNYTDAAASTTRIEFRTGQFALVSTPALATGEAVDLPPIGIPPGCLNICDFTITVDSENQLNKSNKENNRAAGECLVIP